jgi:hypothetical protein
MEDFMSATDGLDFLGANLAIALLISSFVLIAVLVWQNRRQN